MKTQYKCEKCEYTYDSETEAIKCENEHTIIIAPNWWMIPFVGLFMTVYSLFSNKNPIVKFKSQMQKDLITMSPILFIVFLLFLMIILK